MPAADFRDNNISFRWHIKQNNTKPEKTIEIKKWLNKNNVTLKAQ